MAMDMIALSPVLRLAIHTIVGMSLFALIGAAAVLLHHAIVFIEYSRVSPSIIMTLHGIEFLIFASDALCLVVFIIHETNIFLRTILRPGAGHGQTIRHTDA